MHSTHRIENQTMAITRPTRPELIVSGVATAVVERRKYDDAAKKYTSEVTGFEVTISQPNGAQLAVRFNYDANGDLPARVPAVLHPVHVVCALNESREYGASLTVARELVEDDLDRIHSALSAPAKV